MYPGVGRVGSVNFSKGGAHILRHIRRDFGCLSGHAMPREAQRLIHRSKVYLRNELQAMLSGW